MAFVIAAAVGLLVEQLMVRHLYRRPLDTLLATWGLSLIMQQIFRSTFGAKEVSATLPDWLMGSLQPTERIDIPINGLFVMVLTLLLTGGVFFGLFRTRWGIRVRATMQNRVMSGAAGIDTRRIDRFAFALGCGLAGRGRRGLHHHRLDRARPAGRSTSSTPSWWWCSAAPRAWSAPSPRPSASRRPRPPASSS